MKKLITTLLATIAFSGIYAQTEQLTFQHTIEVLPTDTRETILAKAAHIIPTPNQLRALREEFIAFIHLGPNSFTDKEWGNGQENPAVFALKELDTDQWCEAMRDAGIKLVIITAKHHDGFVLWQSRYTKQGVMSTNFRAGKGDIVKDLSASCAKYGLKLGIYLSPADLFHIESPNGLYGNQSPVTPRTIPRSVAGRPFANKKTFQFEVDDYNEYFLNQLFELLTEYGPVHEVWFDGAHPKTKGGQTYNYSAWKTLIHSLAPEAVIFGREDIRWCGNESGATRQTEWNVIPYHENPQTQTNFPDLTNKDLGSLDQLVQGKFLHYQQAEINTSIREGWYYRDDTHQRVRSADDVFDMYERSVGGNATLLLNIPPNRQGRFSQQDVSVLQEVGARIQQTYGIDLLKQGGANRSQIKDNEIVITLKEPITLNRLALGEAIATNGERVAQHAVDAWLAGKWQEIARATNIGYKRILRFADVTTKRLRVRVLESRLTPKIETISAHYYRSRPPQLTIARNTEGKVEIAPKLDTFRWKSHGQNAAQNLNLGLNIYYTTDGGAPTIETAQVYTEPFELEYGFVQAFAAHGAEQGAMSSEPIGYLNRGWIVDTVHHQVSIDFGKTNTLTGFAYTPKGNKSAPTTLSGLVEMSVDGKAWQQVITFEFGNLTNDPTTRHQYFQAPISTRFVRIIPSSNHLSLETLTLY